MTKAISKLRVTGSPDYRKAPSSRVEIVIGFAILVAMFMAVVFAIERQTLLGCLTMAGALIAYMAVTIARNAR